MFGKKKADAAPAPIAASPAPVQAPPAPAVQSKTNPKERVLALLDAAAFGCRSGQEFGYANLVALRDAIAKEFE